MRVGIDYRILSVGSGLIRRGLGRFTQQQLRAVLAADPVNEYVLVCPPGADRFLVDPVVRRARNLSFRHLPIDLVPAIGDGWASRLERSEQFQQWVLSQEIDLFHATTPFYPCEPMLSWFDACPMVATFYDAIPLLFPSHYFLGPADKSIYAFAMCILRAATRVLAISDAGRQDVVDLVGVERERVDLAYPSVDDVFGPMPARDVDRILARLGGRVRIPTQFAFTVSFPHHSKNLETLLLAYSRVPDAVRLQLPLVACCTVDEASAVVWPLAKALGITDDLVLTGRVTDDELAALYNRATFVVHPSRYEGFGLPVAEAMRCATPVITTTTSSLPEIAGGAAVLVDPDDVDRMGAAMLELYESPARRDELVALGLVQSARFTADRLAASTLDCYRRALAPPAARPVRRPRLAVWSPLPPEGGASARTTSALLDELGRSCEVEVFVDDDAQPGFPALGRRAVHHRSAFDRRQSQAGFDAMVYQVDATPAHAYVAAAAGRRPGIAVLHSADGMVDAALAHVVVDPAVGIALARRYPSVRFVEVPLGVPDPGEGPSSVRRKAARAELGGDDGTFVVALFALGATDAAVGSATRAVAMLGGDVVLLEGGMTEAQAGRVRELAARVGLRLAALFDQDDAVAACDVAVCVPTGAAAAREAAVRALAAGRPLLLADPRVASGLETSDLVAQLRALHADPSLLARRAAEARADYEADHTLTESAAAYLEVIAAVTGTTTERRADANARVGRSPDPWDEIVQVLAG